MKLLRDFRWWRTLCRLAAGRRRTAQRAYTVTVPAPLPATTVVELRRPVVEVRSVPPLQRAVNA